MILELIQKSQGRVRVKQIMGGEIKKIKAPKNFTLQSIGVGEGGLQQKFDWGGYTLNTHPYPIPLS